MSCYIPILHLSKTGLLKALWFADSRLLLSCSVWSFKLLILTCRLHFSLESNLSDHMQKGQFPGNPHLTLKLRSSRIFWIIIVSKPGNQMAATWNNHGFRETTEPQSSGQDVCFSGGSDSFHGCCCIAAWKKNMTSEDVSKNGDALHSSSNAGWEVSYRWMQVMEKSSTNGWFSFAMFEYRMVPK